MHCSIVIPHRHTDTYTQDTKRDNGLAHTHTAILHCTAAHCNGDKAVDRCQGTLVVELVWRENVLVRAEIRRGAKWDLHPLQVFFLVVVLHAKSFNIIVV